MSSIDVNEYPKLAAALREVAPMLRTAMRAEKIDRVDLHFGGGSDINVELTFEPRDEYGTLDLRTPEEVAADEQRQRQYEASRAPADPDDSLRVAAH